MAARIAVPAAAEPDVLAVFVAPWRTRVDSASELHHARDAPCDAGDCDTAPQDRTLAQLRRAALAAGGSLCKANFVTQKVLETGGFGRVQLVRVEGVDAPLALKTVRTLHTCRCSVCLTWVGLRHDDTFHTRLPSDARRPQQVELHTQADPSTCGSPNFSSLDARRVKRLQQEIALFSAIAPARCPLLPTLFDAGLYASGRRAYLAMSYVPGTDLRCRLAASDSGRLPVAVAQFFAAEVLLALQLIHDYDFVYRDVKPENVMVNETTGHCVLVDFDLAVRRPDGGADTELAQWADTPLEEAAQAASLFDVTAPTEVSPPTSRRGSLEVDATTDGGAGQAAAAAPVAGTAEYAAPEVLSGAVHGVAADTWQVGVLLYEMLFGATPFAAQRRSKARGASDSGVPTTGELHFGNNDLVFRRIRGAALRFPTDVDADADEAELLNVGVDLLKAMLRRTQAPSDPRVRLGGTCEAAVQRHPFFSGLDWEALPHAPAPVTILPVRLKGSQINLADMSRGLED